MIQRGRIALLGLLVLGTLLAGAARAWAQGYSLADSDSESRSASGSESEAREAPYWGAFEAEIIAQKDPFQKELFGKLAEAYNAEAGWNLFWGLDLLCDLGYRRDSGHRVTQSVPHVPVTNPDVLQLMPFSAVLRWRLQWDPEQWLVPYVRGGGTGVYFHSSAGAKVSDPPVQGVKWGVVAGGGLLWRLDQLDPESHSSLHSEGIDAFYLDTGFHWQRINNFGGRGLDLSGMGGRVGLVAWIR